MQKLSIAAAVVATAFAAMAQTPNCNSAPGAQTFSNRPDFGADYYYNNGAMIFDLNVQVPISITGARTWLYDQGVGNPPVPNQVGNTAIVDVYTCPTSRLGNETLNPANPGSPWTLLGNGTITVVDTGVGNGESPIVFNPPLALAAGSYGVVFVYNAPTSGQNPGPLHCLGIDPATPLPPVGDQFITFSNDGIQGTAWTGIGVDSPNLRILYTPAANAARYQPGGEGCYFRPHAWYENFPSAPGARDLSNTGLQILNLGSNHLIVPGNPAIQPSSSASITLGAYGSSSSGNWDDALSTPLTLPFTFPYPGGSTTDITISSNGSIYLANVVDNSYDVCGASYGTILPFREGPPRIAGFYHDLDPDPVTGSGTLHYDVDPSNQWVRVTWLNVQEWGVPTAISTIQITMYANGNVDIAYGNLANNSAGNNAITGFTPGLGSRLPNAIDISAALPHTAGDGAIPPVLTMDARPVIGTTPNIVTKNVTAGTLAQILVAGLQGLPAPIDLTVFGLPGCYQHINPFTTLVNFINPQNEFSQPFAIPNDPSFQNVQFFFQAAPLTAGLNPAGILTSNGLCTRLGQ